MLGFVRALTGSTNAVDAASITTALGSMPQPVDLPLGGGITFQCGAKPVSFAPSICSADVLAGTLDAKGEGHGLQEGRRRARTSFVADDVRAEWTST